MLVQFGNNWFEKTKKIPGKANWTIFFFHPIISKLNEHVVLVHTLI